MIDVKRANFFYYTAFVLYIVVNTCAQTMIWDDSIPMFGFNIVCLILVLTKILLTRSMDLRELVVWIIAGCVIVFFYVRFNDATPLIILVFVLGAQNCSAEFIAKLHFYIVGGLVVIFTILSQIGIVEDRLITRDEGVGFRHSLGMTYTTIWAGIVGFLLIEYIYLQRKDIQLRHIVIYVAVMLYSYIMTDTRLDLVINSTFLLIVLFYQCLGGIIKSRIHIAAFPLGAITACGLEAAYMVGFPGMETIDSLLSGRLSVAALVLNEYPITLFGSYITMQGNGTVDFDVDLGYFYIDSMFVNYLVRYGIIFMIFIAVIIVYVSYRLYKEGMFFLLVILSFSAINGIIISRTLIPYFDPFYVIAFAAMGNFDDSEEQAGYHWKVRLGTLGQDD